MGNFNEIYEKICEETDKKAMLNAVNEKFLIFITIILIFAFIFLMFFYIQIALIIATISVIGYVIYYFYRIIRPSRKKYEMPYKERYKFLIISKLVKYYDDNLYYHPYLGISMEEYKRAGFNPYDAIDSEDTIKGELGGTLPIKVSDVTVRIKNDPRSSGLPYSVKKFEGLLAQVTLKKSIHSKIFVYKDSFMDGKEILRTESIEFNNYYDMYAEDKLLAMRIFTSDVIDYILHLRKDDNIDFDFTIIDNQLSIRLKCSKMFEPPSQKDFLNKKVLHSYYKTLDTLFTLCQKLADIIESKEL